MTEGELPVDDLKAVAEVLRSGWLTMGPRTLELEAAAAGHAGVAHAVAASSDAAILHLTLLGLGVGEGDEVIVPAVGGAPASHAARRCGATVVIAGVSGPEDPLLDPAAARGAITARTRAVVAVHTAGLPADVVALAAVCDRAGIPLVEHVPGDPAATLDGRPVGTFGVAACAALLPGGAHGGQAAGVLMTDDDALAGYVRSHRSHAMTSGTWARHTGRTDTYDVEGLGFNYRIDEPRAVLAHARLARMPGDLSRRIALAGMYLDALSGVPGAALPTAGGRSGRAGWDAFPVVLEDPSRRDHVRERLAAAGIATMTLPAPPAGRGGGGGRTDARVAEGLLFLPLHAALETEQVAQVALSLEHALTR